jgi:2Fe-2S ferredoxin
MPMITFITSAGESRVVEAPVGTTVMRAAVENDVPGIYGDCGGMRACATCHVHVPESWIGIVGSASESERELLEMAENVVANSRLGCQIEITPELDGITLAVAED